MSMEGGLSTGPSDGNPSTKTRWYWLSFADPDLPEGEQFLGVTIVPVNKWVIDTLAMIEKLPDHLDEDGRAFVTAPRVAALAGQNPGGQVQGHEITDNIHKVPQELRVRLLSKEDLEQNGLV